MQTITITRHGGPAVLEQRTQADPEPKAGELRIKVRACGLNFAEIMARQGLYPDAPKPPCVVGYEASGIIDALGEDVEGFEAGERVCCVSNFGAHAEYVCVPVDQVVRIPDQMSFEEAAAIPVNYITAYHMLFNVANLRPQSRVLVHMAAGGVGTAALQLAKSLEGVEVFGTASASKHEFLRENGCDYAIDYRTKNYEHEVRVQSGYQGVDIVLDALGGWDWRRGYRLLRPAGHLVMFGFANMVGGGKRSILRSLWQLLLMPRFSPLNLMDHNRSVSGVHIGHLWSRKKLLREALERIMKLYEEGVVKPRIDATYSFDQAAEAHQRLENRANMGKVILVPSTVE